MLPSIRSKNLGFTLIELLVTILIIGILATLVSVLFGIAKTKARDVKRVSDIKTINTALQLYYEDEGHYPVADSSLGDPDGQPDQFIIGESLIGPTTGRVYLSTIPSNPTPRNEGSSNNPTESDYVYTSKDGSTYSLEFWLAGDTGEAQAGQNISFPDQPFCSVDCGAYQCGDVCGQSCGTCGAGKSCLNHQCVDSIYVECTAANNLGDRCGGGYLYYKNPNLVAAPAGCVVVGGVYTCSGSSDDSAFYWKYPPSAATAGTSDDNDGRNNAAGLPASRVDEIGSFCNNMSVFGFDDYYVPAAYELGKIFDQKSYIAGGVYFSGMYWSSTQWSSNTLNAVGFSFSTTYGSCYTGVRYNCDDKTNQYRVRCIRRANF